MTVATAFLLSLFTTISLIPVINRVARRYNLFDQPGGRKIHTRAVPRIGGVAMVAGASLPVFLWTGLSLPMKTILLGVGMLSILGLVDDLITVSWQKKILVQAVAALLVIFYGHVEITYLGYWAGSEIHLHGWLSILLTFFFIMGVTNAINLVDGLDGLAAGICIFIFGELLFLAHLQGLDTYSIPLVAIIGAIWGFLRFNTYPATIFMGDSGSYFLGFSVAVLSILCTQTGHSAVSPAVVLLILGLPIVDTLWVMVERARLGNPIFLPDRRHLHFRLMKTGFSHREAVMIIYAIQALLTFISIKWMFYPAPRLFLVFVLFSLALVGAVTLAQVKGWRFHRAWSIENLLRSRLGARTRLWLAKIPTLTIAGLMATYMLLVPFMSNANMGKAGLSVLLVPILLSVGIVLKKEWFAVIIRMSLYYLTAILTLYITSTREPNPGYLGLPAWYLGFLIAVGTSTLFYIKLAGPGLFKVSPLDILILLVTLAIPILPRSGLASEGNIDSIIVSLVILAYAIEVVLNQRDVLYYRLVGMACVISALIIGTKTVGQILS